MRHMAQVVMAPHVYPPSISQVEGGSTTLGSYLFKRLSEYALASSKALSHFVA